MLHGLVNVGNMTLPLHTMATPCIEIHDIIAQYIIEEIPYDYHLFLSKVDITGYSFDCFLSVFSSNLDCNISLKNHIVDTFDILLIPLIIRFFAVCTRAKQVEFSEAVNCLIENYSDIVKTNSLIKFFNAKQPLSQIYGFVKENCRMMQSLLADNRYDEAEAWLCEYVDNHPCTIFTRSIQALNNELMEECKHNPDIVKLIDKTIGSYGKDINVRNVGKAASVMIHTHNIASEMIKAGVSDAEIADAVAYSLNRIE